MRFGNSKGICNFDKISFLQGYSGYFNFAPPLQCISVYFNSLTNTGNFGVFSTKVQMITVLIQLSLIMNELAPFQLFRATHISSFVYVNCSCPFTYHHWKSSPEFLDILCNKIIREVSSWSVVWIANTFPSFGLVMVFAYAELKTNKQKQTCLFKKSDSGFPVALKVIYA